MFAFSYSSCRGASSMASGSPVSWPTGRPEPRARGAPGSASPVTCVFCLNYVVYHREALIGDVCAPLSCGSRTNAVRHRVLLRPIRPHELQLLIMKLLIALALSVPASAIVGGSRAASVYVIWPHEDEQLRTRYNCARAHGLIRAPPHANAASRQGAHYLRTRE